VTHNWFGRSGKENILAQPGLELRLLCHQPVASRYIDVPAGSEIFTEYFCYCTGTFIPHCRCRDRTGTFIPHCNVETVHELLYHTVDGKTVQEHLHHNVDVETVQELLYHTVDVETFMNVYTTL
jgi:hypothetical protein